jgi:hypothetical protein
MASDPTGRTTTHQSKDPLKVRLLEKVDFPLEYSHLLGEGRGNVRSCFAHADATPSLSFNPKNGAWKCHSCNEKGDVFSLFEKVKKWSFPEAYEYLLHRYKLYDEVRAMWNAGNKHAFKTYPLVLDESWKNRIALNMQEWYGAPERVKFMKDRYGLELETLYAYKIGLSKQEQRVWIPVFAKENSTGEAIKPFVNVRRHDAFRACAEWRNKKTGTFLSKKEIPTNASDMLALETSPDSEYEPKWGDRGGKVISIKNHGSCYLYPMHVMFDSPAMYVTGGELKALLLIQHGFPAVTFTTGENSYPADLLPLFLKKRVRVIMDVDEAGIRGANNLAQVLANSGAIVEVCDWGDDIIKALPPKGDITDYLRLAGWNKEAMDYLTWRSVERQQVDEDTMLTPTLVGEHVDTDNLVTIPFNQLVNPQNLKKWVKVNGLVAGRGEAPFAVPRRVTVTCDVGRTTGKPQCVDCPLPRCGFTRKVEFTIEKQVEMLGGGDEMVKKEVRIALDLPKCNAPNFETEHSVIEELVLSPRIDMDQNSGVDKDDFEYAHRSALVIREEKIDLKENQTYMMSGKIMAAPKTGKFIFAARKFENLENDILHYRHNLEEFRSMQHEMGCADYQDPVASKAALNQIVTDMREHITNIYGQDDMIQTALLSMFVPFQFSIKNVRCERVCPAFMILGDTNTGKSTVVKAMIRHYGAGRYATMESQATFAGLVGGNYNSGRSNTFTWGLLPTSHRGFAALDEMGEMPLEILAGLSNLLTNGIAERTTVSGVRKTLANVRLLYMCNPRGAKPLGSYSNPLDAVMGVMGTVQAMGRLEFVHVQQRKDDASFFNQNRTPSGPLLYTKELARAHMRWAWAAKEFVFVNTDFLYEKATALVHRFGQNGLLLAAQARFKIGRLACGLALLTMSSHDATNVMIYDHHVQMAYDMFVTSYGDGSAETPQAGVLHPQIVGLLNRFPRYMNLRFLATSDNWNKADMDDAIGEEASGDLISLLQFTLGLITRRGSNYWVRNPKLLEQLEEYITTRERGER